MMSEYNQKLFHAYLAEAAYHGKIADENIQSPTIWTARQTAALVLTSIATALNEAERS